MLMMEPEIRPQPSVVDKLDYRVEFLEAIFQRSAGQDDRVQGAQTFYGFAGLGFPVLYPLPFIENDQIPSSLFDISQITKNLLVVANCKKLFTEVEILSLRRRSRHYLHRAPRKALDLIPPLRFHGCRTDHQDLSDPALPGKELRRADRLYCFSKPHVVGQNGSPRPDTERDTLELIGHEFGLEQFPAQRMTGRIPAHIFRQVLDTFFMEFQLDQLFGIRVDHNIIALCDVA